MKNSRLFEILYLLMEKRAVTAKELAQRLEVSERTIYRDVDALSAAGIPVFAQQGQGGGIRLMEQFVLDKALLSQAQQDEILFALQAVLSTGGASEKETLAQLTALFHREGGDWLEVDFTDWGSGSAERETFTLVKKAALTQRPTVGPGRTGASSVCPGWNPWLWKREPARRGVHRNVWKLHRPLERPVWTCGCGSPPLPPGGFRITSIPGRSRGNQTAVCWWSAAFQRTNGFCRSFCPLAVSWRCCLLVIGGTF